MLDWNDLRYFLAVAREGSTLAAARSLRVSQTTVARRISALEEAIGVRLFEKRQAGYSPTTAGHELVRLAEQVEVSVTGFTDAANAQSRELRGAVKLTTEEAAIHAACRNSAALASLPCRRMTDSLLERRNPPPGLRSSDD